MVTIRDVAKASGVSIATVSKVINGRDQHISEETRERVRSAILKCGYISNSIARGLKTKKTFTIGFLLPDISNPFFGSVSRGVQDEASKRGYSVIVCNTDGNVNAEIKSLELLESKMVDGIIISRILADVNSELYEEKYPDLFKRIPTVVLDDGTTLDMADDCGRVLINAEKAIYEGTCALIEAGCKRIAYISEQGNGGYRRSLGYLRALNERGMAINDELIVMKDYSIQGGKEAMESLLQAGIDVDGIICGNDMIAIGVLSILKRCDISVPEQIKIIGMDNIPFSEHIVPSLSTMAQPMHEIGTAAADMLINAIEEEAPLYIKMFEAKLVERETFQCVRKEE